MRSPVESASSRRYARAMSTAAALPPKSVGTAYLFMLFSLVGVCGIQHFYLGKIGRGILWLLTVGLFGIGTIVDIFTLPSQTKTINARRAVGIG
ncbi:MAG: TM2 domain-containing protein [Micrococcales bacterium]|nr:TM2 domain-containing protein [Micrococcales bacterium]